MLENEQRIKRKLLFGIPLWMILAVSCRKPMYPSGAFTIIDRETDGLIKKSRGALLNYESLLHAGFIRLHHEELHPPHIRKYYEATELGVEALNHARTILFRLYDGADAVLASFGVDVSTAM